MADVRAVAKHFLSLSEEGTPLAITPLKLQKLVYYAQGFYLSEHKGPLFNDQILAWDHGPVVRKLWEDYNKYKYFTIPKSESDNNIQLLPEEIASIKRVWEKYGSYDGKTLEEMTHQEDPWLFTKKDQEITINKIKQYFIEQPVLS